MGQKAKDIFYGVFNLIAIALWVWVCLNFSE